MVLTIGVCVHAVDTEAHATVPDGWRWAVHVGADWGDLGSCLNAGWEPSEVAARLAGEAAAVCAVKVARLLAPGDDVDMTSVALDVDPIPGGADRITVGA
jgi:hypothetical protein